MHFVACALIVLIFVAGAAVGSCAPKMKPEDVAAVTKFCADRGLHVDPSSTKVTCYPHLFEDKR